MIRGLRGGLRLGQGTLEDSLWEALTDTHCGCSMAVTAENCAAKYGISRQAQDGYACAASSSRRPPGPRGVLDEVVPVEVKSRKGVEAFTRDDHMRPQTRRSGLAKLPAAFSKNGCVTAGNASGIVDGGAALILASGAAAERIGVTPLGRLAGWATTGVEPTLMGMGPAPATRKLLARTGLTLADIDLFEINEAFAAQYLAVEQELGLPREAVNVNGGAIALGHPLGMSGTRLLLTLALEMRRRGAHRGVAAACIGGGQGMRRWFEATTDG